MDYYSLSDKGIETELGQRLKSLRLQKNITQKELAENTTLSLNTIKSLESGRGKISSLIAVLRELGTLDQLDALIPVTSISPIQLIKMQGKVRERASGDRGQSSAQDEAKNSEQEYSKAKTGW